MKTSGIYGFYNKTNGHCYVGSSANLTKRKLDHIKKLRSNTHYNTHLQAAWNKYHEENFAWCIIEIVEQSAHLLEREQFWIEALASEYNVCKNATSPLGVKRSEETKAKLSALYKGKPLIAGATEKAAEVTRGKPRSPEVRLKMSESIKAALAKPEVQAKLANRNQKMKARFVSEETKAKLSVIASKRTYSEETRAKMSASQKARKRSPLTEHTKALISQKNQERQEFCVRDDKGKFVRFDLPSSSPLHE